MRHFYSFMGGSYPLSSDVWLAQVIMLALVVVWIWLLIDCARRNFKNNLEKGAWILAMIFVPGIASVAYWIAVKYANPQGILDKDIRV